MHRPPTRVPGLGVGVRGGRGPALRRVPVARVGVRVVVGVAGGAGNGECAAGAPSAPLGRAERYYDKARDYVEASEAFHLDGDAWSSRRFAQEEEAAGREHVNAALEQIRNTATVIHRLEHMRLTLVDPADGLFQLPSSEDPRVALALSGTSYFLAAPGGDDE